MPKSAAIPATSVRLHSSPCRRRSILPIVLFIARLGRSLARVGMHAPTLHLSLPLSKWSSPQSIHPPPAATAKPRPLQSEARTTPKPVIRRCPSPLSSSAWGNEGLSTHQSAFHHWDSKHTYIYLTIGRSLPRSTTSHPSAGGSSPDRAHLVPPPPSRDTDVENGYRKNKAVAMQHVMVGAELGQATGGKKKKKKKKKKTNKQTTRRGAAPSSIARSLLAPTEKAEKKRQESKAKSRRGKDSRLTRLLIFLPSFVSFLSY